MSFRFLGGPSGSGSQGEQVVTPTDTFIDPVSKIRVSQPSNLIDTDFEYGLQPTKWETVELINNTPAFFSKGGDTTISDITSISTNAGTREITVTTAFPHELAPGIPIRVSGTKSVSADGSYIINATPSATSFTYLARANQPDTVSIFDLFASIITGEFFQGSQISIADAEGIVTDAQGATSDLTVRTTTKHGFGVNTPFYFLNLNSTVSQEFESQNSTSVTFDPTNAATAINFDGSNTLLQTPVDLSNSATTSSSQSTVSGVSTANDTITVTLSGEDWSELSVGDPLYYSASSASGFFSENPRGVVFIKNVDGIQQNTATFQVSLLPDGDPIDITANITGFFQIADQARTFAGNNVNEETQVTIEIVADESFFFDGNNDGNVDAPFTGVTTFNVTNDGSGAYLINGESNPTINIARGETFTFNIDASGHPFWIQSVAGAYSASDTLGESDGVTNNGTDNGTITYVVPNSAPDDLYYACQFHSSMQGAITVSGGSDAIEATVVGYSGSNITVSASSALAFYTGAMVKYETSDNPAQPLVNNGSYFVTSFQASGTPGLFTMSLSETPGGTAITYSNTGSGTQTFNRIGIALDKDIIHVRDADFNVDDMVRYDFPESGAFGYDDEGAPKRFFFIREKFDASNFRLSDRLFSPIVATGGNLVQDLEINGILYRIHVFTTVGSSQTFEVQSAGSEKMVDLLVIGGGGSGGRNNGGGSGKAAGGGGAGEMLAQTGVLISSGSLGITVGNGGAEPASDAEGNDGENSVALGFTVNGGGGGGRTFGVGRTGGSSGGHGNNGGATRTPVTLLGGGTGHEGGLAHPTAGSPDPSGYTGGGGGGAGGPGVNGANYANGDGGPGAANDFRTGSNVFYAGGGGGSAIHSSPTINGGIGGGGKGGNQWFSRAGEPGVANTGSGGGGGYNMSGAGGSGIVVIRYPLVPVG